jgi:osmotically inducible lipoprotein OsmB
MTVSEEKKHEQEHCQVDRGDARMRPRAEHGARLGSKARLAAIALAMLCSACASHPTREQIGTVTGAVVGGVVGSALTAGSTAGTVAGAGAGALVGSELGRNFGKR